MPYPYGEHSYGVHIGCAGVYMIISLLMMRPICRSLGWRYLWIVMAEDVTALSYLVIHFTCSCVVALSRYLIGLLKILWYVCRTLCFPKLYVDLISLLMVLVAWFTLLMVSGHFYNWVDLCLSLSWRGI